jgi:hypothetical protein
MNQRRVPRVPCIAACVLTMAVLVGCGDDARRSRAMMQDQFRQLARRSRQSLDLRCDHLSNRGCGRTRVSGRRSSVPSMEELYTTLGATQADADASSGGHSI